MTRLTQPNQARAHARPFIYFTAVRSLIRVSTSAWRAGAVRRYRPILTQHSSRRSFFYYIVFVETPGPDPARRESTHALLTVRYTHSRAPRPPLVSTHAQVEPTTLPSGHAPRSGVPGSRGTQRNGTWYASMVQHATAAHASQPLACTPCQAHPPSSLLILAVCRSSRPNHRHAGGTVCAPSSHAATRPRWRRPWPGAPGSIGISGRHDRVAQRRTPPPHRRRARHCAGTAPFSSGVTNSSASSVL